MTDVVQGMNPRTGAPTGTATAVTTAAELDQIMISAASAFSGWSAAAAEQRATALRLIADRLDAASDVLVEVADSETALGAARLSGEVARTTAQLRMFAGLVLDGAYLDVIISPAEPHRARPDVRRMLMGRGPVAVFSASNFPFAFSVAGGDTASALAAGCPVVVKAHEAHPATSAAVAAIVTAALHDAGAPAGTFAVVYGPSIGAPLVRHPSTSAVGFTGSLGGGRALFEQAVARPDPIPFYGELGSVNPVVVLPDAASTRAVEIADGYVASLTLGAGQFCTNPGLLFVPQDRALLSRVADAVSASSAGPMLSERIADAYQHFGKWDRLELLAAGTPSSAAFTARPEVRQVNLAEFAADPSALADERFGPGGLIVTYERVDDLSGVLARVPGSLTASVHAGPADRDAVQRIAPVLQRTAGRLIMNGWPTGVAVCWAMHHGGPWPASTNARHTSVGAAAIDRWLVPVAYQDWPDELLPPELQSANPLGVPPNRTRGSSSHRSGWLATSEVKDRPGETEVEQMVTYRPSRQPDTAGAPR